MRPFECVQAAVTVAVSAASFVNADSWKFFALPACVAVPLLAVAALSIASLLQRSLEGFRWQLAPLAWAAYSQAFVLVFGVGTVFYCASDSTQQCLPQPLLPYIIKYAAGAGIVFAVVSICLAVVLPVFTLPKPSGPHQVASFELELIDHSRPEWIAPWQHDTNKPRRLLARMIYPADLSGIDQSNLVKAFYDAHMKRNAAAIAADRKVPSFFFQHFELTRSHAWTFKSPPPPSSLTHIIPPCTASPSPQPPLPSPHSPLSSSPPSSPASPSHPLPVLLYSHGYCGFYNQNTALLEDLASHGYFMLAISHTYDALTTFFPSSQEVLSFNATAPPKIRAVHELHELRSRQLQLRVEDVSFALQQLHLLNTGALPTAPDTVNQAFKGRLDMHRVGVVGHSFGGATALVAGSSVEGVKAVLALDAWSFTIPEELRKSGLEKPVACIQADRFFVEHTPFGKGNGEQVRSLVGASRSGVLVEVEKVGHYEFTDATMYAPVLTKFVLKGTRWFRPVLHHLLAPLALDWFNAALNGGPEGARGFGRELAEGKRRYEPEHAVHVVYPKREGGEE